MLKYSILIIISLLLAACTPIQTGTSSPSPLPSTPANTWEGLPIFPDAVEVKDNSIGYHYTIADVDILTVQRFYKEEAPVAGWEPLAVIDTSSREMGKAWSLLFTKGKTIAQVDIFTRENVTNVVLHFE